MHASQPSSQYLSVEQVLDPDSIWYTTIEEMALPSAIGFANSDFGLVTALKAENDLSGSGREVLREENPHDLVNWLATMDHLEKLEASYFPLTLKLFEVSPGTKIADTARGGE